MKLLKKVFIASAITMSAFTVAPKIIPNMQSAYTVQAASVKISETKKTMYKGYTYKLKVTGTSKKVTWTSSDKSKATVSSKGKVYAKKNGKVTITAKVGSKKYNCKVTVKNKPYNLIQFKNTTFYDLKDVAIEQRNISKIKNYKDFNIDLDGDGKKDKITVKNKGKNEYGNYTHEISLNEKVFFEEEDSVLSAIYIVDLNKNDNKKEIIVKCPDGGDSTFYYIYLKKGNQMKLERSIGYACISNDLKVNQEGKILLASTDMERISPKVYNKYYYYNGKKIKEKKLDVKKIKNVKFSLNYAMLFTTNMKNTEKYMKYNNSGMEHEKALEKAKIYDKKYKNFKILKFTDDGDDGLVYVKLNDGKKGYLFTGVGYLFG